MSALHLRKRLTTLLCGAALLALAVAALPALAEEQASPPPEFAPPSVNFEDPGSRLAHPVDVDTTANGAGRMSPIGPPAPESATDQRAYQVQLRADGSSFGVPVGVSLLHRRSLGADDHGDPSHSGRSSEVRVGSPIPERQSNPGWYAFAASDDQALTWNPGSRTAFGNRGGAQFGLQDRVQIGDHQAGITYEAGNGLQASLAYVERRVDGHAGTQSYSHQENFTGITVTMRH